MKVREIEKKCKTVEEALEELEKEYGKFEFVKYNEYEGWSIYYNEKLGYTAIRKICGNKVEIDVLGC